MTLPISGRRNDSTSEAVGEGQDRIDDEQHRDKKMQVEEDSELDEQVRRRGGNEDEQRNCRG